MLRTHANPFADTSRRHPERSGWQSHQECESRGQQLALFVFLIFGLAAVPPAAKHWDATAWVYAILSLRVKGAK